MRANFPALHCSRDSRRGELRQSHWHGQKCWRKRGATLRCPGSRPPTDLATSQTQRLRGCLARHICTYQLVSVSWSSVPASRDKIQVDSNSRP
ncbi:unnamed protein product [Protopolystoma xenopodis]|uniref:Uncharacterized protein n=1 Tax=Protopolystoma xenopodis TaxID=117903 RepID=A0A448XRU4_9PLAT|nr:unnamed protein product [Protopolystoma xenopodis]